MCNGSWRYGGAPTDAVDVDDDVDNDVDNSNNNGDNTTTTRNTQR